MDEEVLCGYACVHCTILAINFIINFYFVWAVPSCSRLFLDFFLNSRLATTAIKQLPPDVIAAAQNNALWSKDEEHLLSNIPVVCSRFP